MLFSFLFYIYFALLESEKRSFVYYKYNVRYYAFFDEKSGVFRGIIIPKDKKRLLSKYELELSRKITNREILNTLKKKGFIINPLDITYRELPKGIVEIFKYYDSYRRNSVSYKYFYILWKRIE